MSRRRSALVLLLVAAMSALALAVGLGTTAVGDVKAAGTEGEGAFGREIRPGLDSAVARVRLDEPRSPAEPRSSRTGLALLTVLGLLALVPLLGYRRIAGRSAVSVPAVWWSPIRGRAPPPFQLAVS